MPEVVCTGLRERADRHAPDRLPDRQPSPSTRQPLAASLLLDAAPFGIRVAADLLNACPVRSPLAFVEPAADDRVLDVVGDSVIQQRRPQHASAAGRVPGFDYGVANIAEITVLPLATVVGHVGGDITQRPLPCLGPSRGGTCLVDPQPRLVRVETLLRPCCGRCRIERGALFVAHSLWHRRPIQGLHSG